MSMEWYLVVSALVFSIGAGGILAFLSSIIGWLGVATRW